MSGKDEVREDDAVVGALETNHVNSDSKPLNLYPIFNTKNWNPATRGGRPPSGPGSAGGVKRERDENSRSLAKHQRSSAALMGDNNGANSAASSSASIRTRQRSKKKTRIDYSQGEAAERMAKACTSVADGSTVRAAAKLYQVRADVLYYKC